MESTSKYFDIYLENGLVKIVDNRHVGGEGRLILTPIEFHELRNLMNDAKRVYFGEL